MPDSGWDRSSELRRVGFDFLSNAARCDGVEALDQQFMELAQAFGFKSAGLIRLLEAGGPLEPKIIFGSAPMEWVERYIEKEYGAIDPTLPMAFQSRRAFTWKRAEQRDRSPEVRTFFGEAKELFAKDSFIVPVWGPYGELSVVNMGADRPLEFSEEEKSLLEGMCSLYASIGLSLAHPGLPPEPEETKTFTRREGQCVYWTAMGKHDQEIAVILDISPLTVRAYLDSARVKLDVTTRPELIRKALTLGILMPDRSMFR